MSPRLRTTLVASLLSIAFARPAAAVAPREVAITGTRIHVGDVLPSATGTTAAIDLGPTPQAGGSRLLTRKDLVAALGRGHATVPAQIPDAVRVVRKTRRLAAWDLDAVVRTAMAGKALHAGVVLAQVEAERSVDVVEGYANVDVDVPRTPKKAGAFATSVVVSFLDADDQVLLRVPVPVVFAVSEEGAQYDTPRGTSVMLVVRRNLVEVRVPGVATADADVGDALPVQIRTSGHVLHAKLIGKDEALAQEDAR